jgi:aldehyde:ferredoxin oxidoreductase
VVAKSPLTGMLTDALASSHFAIAGKLTGHDAIVLVGRAAAPTTVVVDGDGVRLLDAGPQWGLTAAEAEASVRDRLGGGWQVASIGSAGERGVRFATISHDGRHAGRGGLGAVMGAKRVKALAVRAVTKVAPRTRRGCWLRRRTCASAPRAGPPRSTGSSGRSPTCWPSTR